MSDVQKVLKELREEVGECRILSNFATDPEKRKLFATVAERLTQLASAVENELALAPADVTHVTGQEPADMAVVCDPADSPVVQKTRSSRMHPWFLMVALAVSAGASLAAGGAFVTGSGEKNLVGPVEAKVVPPPTPEQDTKGAMAEFQAAEENKRNLLLQQLDALAARIDSFETARAEKLEKARAEIVEPVTKRDGARLRRVQHRKTAASNSHTLRLGWGF